MKIKLKSKWTSVNSVNGWRHYEVSEFNSKKNIFKLFAVCDKKKFPFSRRKPILGMIKNGLLDGNKL